jgi:hypothetical protein
MGAIERKDLTGQSFAGHDLRGVSFEQCNLTGCDFRGATTDDTTVLFDCNVAGIRIDFGSRSFDALLIKCYGRDPAFRSWQKKTLEETRERKRLGMREWRRENPELARQQQRRFYEANREQQIAKVRLHYLKDPAKKIAQTSAWIKANRARQTAYYRKRRHAKKRREFQSPFE